MGLPPDVELVSDVSPAGWVVAALRPWLAPGASWSVTSVVPGGYEAYGRIEHGGEPVDLDAGEVPRFEGELPDELMRPLLQVLASHTSTPHTCWFCVWDGYGHWWKHAHERVYVPGDDPEERVAVERLAAEEAQRSAERDATMRRAPRLRGEGRDYFVFRGPLISAAAFSFDGWDQPPNLWWPDDRAWCVGTDIDLNRTFVAGTGRCIDDVVAALPRSASVVHGDDPAS